MATLPHQHRSPGIRLGKINLWKTTMNNLLLKLYVKFLELKDDDEGQDMVEYALVVALIALAAVSSMQHVGTALTNRFNSISSAVG
jgi:pilus assembly protein Flp/PilA